MEYNTFSKMITQNNRIKLLKTNIYRQTE